MGRVGKPPKVRAPKPGRAWPDKVRARGVELLESTRNVTDALDGLVKSFEFVTRAPGRGTVAGWAKAAGIELEALPGRRRDTKAATSARLDRLEEAREVLAEDLLKKLTRPAVDAIARRLTEDADLDEPVRLARQAYLDALHAERAQIDLDPNDEDAIAGARRVVKAKRKDLEVLVEGRLTVHTLVGVTTRAIADHLALEGIGTDQQATGDLIVELLIPRPDPAKSDAEAVPQDEIPERAQ